MYCTTLIKAIDPSDLVDQVNDYLKCDYDLHTPLFVDHNSTLCLFVVPHHCMEEYRLIVADDLDDLETQARNLIELGFDFQFHTVMWYGKYLQWMSRMNESGARVRDAIAQVFTPARAPSTTHVAEVDDDGLMPSRLMVERAQPLAHLSLLRDLDGGYAVTPPFPLRLS